MLLDIIMDRWLSMDLSARAYVSIFRSIHFPPNPQGEKVRGLVARTSYNHSSHRRQWRQNQVQSPLTTPYVQPRRLDPTSPWQILIAQVIICGSWLMTYEFSEGIRDLDLMAELPTLVHLTWCIVPLTIDFSILL
jgi:hypothetical protein